MEDGIASSGVMVINITNGDPAPSAQNLLRVSQGTYLNKTWQQIFDAMNAGRLCVIKDGDETGVGLNLVTGAGVSEDKSYTIFAIGNVTYAASSADGYPHQ